MAVSVPSFAALIPGCTSIDQKTITLWLQVAFSAGTYVTGGVPAGLQAFAGTLTVNDSEYLWSSFQSEEPFTTSLGIGGFTYRYNPTNDTFQIFDGAPATGTELTNGSTLPVGVTGDVITGQVVYNRLAA
jgi:hypothetical protein